MAIIKIIVTKTQNCHIIAPTILFIPYHSERYLDNDDLIHGQTQLQLTRTLEPLIACLTRFCHHFFIRIHTPNNHLLFSQTQSFYVPLKQKKNYSFFSLFFICIMNSEVFAYTLSLVL